MSLPKRHPRHKNFPWIKETHPHTLVTVVVPRETSTPSTGRPYPTIHVPRLINAVPYTLIQPIPSRPSSTPAPSGSWSTDRWGSGRRTNLGSVTNSSPVVEVLTPPSYCPCIVPRISTTRVRDPEDTEGSTVLHWRDWISSGPFQELCVCAIRKEDLSSYCKIKILGAYFKNIG